MKQKSTPSAFKLFVSSPSGMQKEHAVIRGEIRALSNQKARQNKPGLSIVQWPSDLAAGVADYGQSVINRQTSDYDIFVCVVGTRMGTSTPRAVSGTEEEFDRAIEAVLGGRRLQVLLFFNNTPVEPQSLDPNQLILVRAFRDKARRLGVLYHTFRSREELRKLFRISIREAYDHVRNKSEIGPHGSTLRRKTTLPSTTTLDLGNVVLIPRITGPQWADKFLIPLAEYRRRSLRLTGVLKTSAVYFRFGFKYFDSREPLFSAGSVQTVGQNILIHVGKNVDSQRWFLTRYRAGYRLGPDQPIDGTEGLTVASFALDITSSDSVVFSLNGNPIYQAFFPIDGLPLLALLAWGDEHEPVCEVQDLQLHVEAIPDVAQ